MRAKVRVTFEIFVEDMFAFRELMEKGQGHDSIKALEILDKDIPFYMIELSETNVDHQFNSPNFTHSKEVSMRLKSFDINKLNK